jgi:hypothetical protein
MVIRGYFKIDVYQCTIHIIVTDDTVRSINSLHNKFNYLPIDYAVEGYVVSSEDTIGDYYVVLDSDRLCVNGVNHEKSHVVEHILQDRGIKPNSEVRSYLDGFVSNKFDLFFKKRKLKLKNT